MSDVKKLTPEQKRDLRPLVKDAQHLDTCARHAWSSVAAYLDSIGSHGHSQCCPVGGIRMAGRACASGEMPCPCGYTVEVCKHKWFVEINVTRTGDPTTFFTGNVLCSECGEVTKMATIAPNLEGVLTREKATP